jgi:hypothetical protein
VVEARGAFGAPLTIPVGFGEEISGLFLFTENTFSVDGVGGTTVALGVLLVVPLVLSEVLLF